jgi:hypothetical protein
MPGAPELLGIEGIKVIFNVTQTPTKFAGMQVLLRVLTTPASFLDASEIGGRHKSLAFSTKCELFQG